MPASVEVRSSCESVRFRAFLLVSGLRTRGYRFRPVIELN